MTPAVEKAARRILLGIGELHGLHISVVTAASLASGLGTGLRCVVVEHGDLLALAGLPFSRAVGRGGISSPMTLQLMESYFRNLSRAVERELIETCARLNIDWALARPSGQYVEELSAAAEGGDIIVVSRRDIAAVPGELLKTARRLLEKAAAIVVPAIKQDPGGAVLAFTTPESGGDAQALAVEIAAALRAPLEIMDFTDFPLTRRKAAIVVAPLALAEATGERLFLQRIDAMGAGAVLVPGKT